MPDIERWPALVVMVALGIPCIAPAQEPETRPAAKDGADEQSKEPEKAKARNKSRRRKGLSPGQVLVKRFDRAAPQIGDPLPDAAGFDEEGNPFKLRSLKGHYTVLTFGCLT